MNKNQLICGDCFDEMRKLQDSSINLVYLDPPSDEFKARGIDNYNTWFQIRLKEIHRILNPTGTVVCRSNQNSNHYHKTSLDRIFGVENFRNELIRNYLHNNKIPNKHFPMTHDTFFVYSKAEYIFNFEYTIGNNELTQNFTGKDFGQVPLTDYHILKSEEKFMTLSDCFSNYKVKDLLELIINSYTNINDVVLIPFCRNIIPITTTLSSRRNFIGINSNPKIIREIQPKMGTNAEVIGLSTTLNEIENMEPHEFQQWACDKMIARNIGNPNSPSGPDDGIDGIIEGNESVVNIFNGAILQVKRNVESTVGVRTARDLFAVMVENGTKYGFIVGFSFASTLVKKIHKYRHQGLALIELVSAEELLDNKYDYYNKKIIEKLDNFK